MAPRPLAVLTGASSGIGAALAPLLAADGYDLLLVARREGLLKDLAAKIARDVPGARAEPFALDLVAPGAAANLVERAPDARLVVNCAGFGLIGDALELPLEDVQRMIALNVAALTDLTLRYGRRMAGGGGGVVFNVASTAAFQPIPYFAAYAATKAYIVSLSEGLDYEVRGRGVRVLAFCPGPTRTEFSSVAGVSAEHQARGDPFYQRPEDVAASAARAIRRRKETRVPGLVNNVAVVLAKIAPRRVARWFAAQMFRPPAARNVTQRG